MSDLFSSESLLEVQDRHPMTLWSCLLYVIANIIGMVLYWMYQQARAARLRQEESGYVDNSSDAYGRCNSNGSGSGLFTNYNYRSSTKLRGSNSSLLSVLGLSYNGYRTFFAFEDRFYNFEEVGRACQKAGLDNCSLIVGVDFSASNEWQGRKCFAGQNLHRVVPGKILNPYQKVISIMGRTLEMFDQDNLIPAYGFGDSITRSKSVFPFRENENPCKGFADVLDCYSDIASRITLGGPTNLAPVIHRAVDIVKRLKRYHILIIIADGQVTEHNQTVEAIVEASNYPLSIVVVGVGDGPWNMMETFDNCLPERNFDNFQFVNYHEAVRKSRKNPDATFALHTMMEIPDQFKTIKALGYLDESPTEETDNQSLNHSHHSDNQNNKRKSSSHHNHHSNHQDKHSNNNNSSDHHSILHHHQRQHSPVIHVDSYDLDSALEQYHSSIESQI